MASSFFMFLDHTQRRSTVSRTPLDERSAGRRDLYLTTYYIQTEKHPCSRRDSNPQSQQASACRPTLLTARPLGKECMWPPSGQILNSGSYLNLPSVCYSGSETFERTYAWPPQRISLLYSLCWASPCLVLQAFSWSWLFITSSWCQHNFVIKSYTYGILQITCNSRVGLRLGKLTTLVITFVAGAEILKERCLPQTLGRGQA